jgi:hypothetical protein
LHPISKVENDYLICLRDLESHVLVDDDLNSVTFKALLWYLYGDTISLDISEETQQDITLLEKVASKYGVTRLAALCQAAQGVISKKECGIWLPFEFPSTLKGDIKNMDFTTVSCFSLRLIIFRPRH